MKELEKIVDSNGEPLEIVDAEAREDISEIKQSLSDLTLLEKTASGAIATFNDGSDLPMPSLKVAIEPLQSGSGDPSPTNIRPISGWSECNVGVSGVNVWDEEWEVGGINVNTGQNESATDIIRCKNHIPVKPNTAYHIVDSSKVYCLFLYDKNKNYITSVNVANIQGANYTIRNDCYYIRFRCFAAYGTTYNNDISINYPSTDTSYHAYNGQTYTIDLDGTRYGGTLDVVSGVLTVDRYVKTFTGTENISRQAHSKNRFYYAITDIMVEMSTSTMKGSILPPDNTIVYDNDKDKIFYWYSGYGIYWRWDDYTSESSMQTKLAELYANGTPLQMLATLTTPLTIQLTPTQVNSLLGVNNIWANTGELELTYFVNNSFVYCIYDMINILTS